jgi:CRISPR-associated protein Cmr5
MSVHTRSQKLAQGAYARIRGYGKPKKEYVSFAKKFPTLIHTCGLAQAVAFALAKKEIGYVGDLAAVLNGSGHPDISSAQTLHERTRTLQLSGYLRLSRDAISAAGWLKRYVEAAGEDD